MSDDDEVYDDSVESKKDLLADDEISPEEEGFFKESNEDYDTEEELDKEFE